MTQPKPKHLGPEYGAQFSDRSVVEAYVYRPPYPDEVYTILADLIVDAPRNVLELGCGPGEIARGLAARVAHVDAVDPSQAMLDLARTLPGSERSNLNWHCCSAETFTYPRPYALAITAESLHWMDWERVLPAIRASLTPRAKLVIILGRRLTGMPWREALQPLLSRYSTNKDFQPYNLLDELAVRQLFRLEGRATTQPVPFTQTVEACLEALHSANGFSRTRMVPTQAQEFDERVREIITPYAEEGLLHHDLQVEMVWGAPAPI